MSRPIKVIGNYVFIVILSAGLAGCYGVRPSAGGSDAKTLTRRTDPSDIALPRGYQAEVIATGLTFPTGITFDEQGEAYVVESGYSYGETWAEPRLLKHSSPCNSAGSEALYLAWVLGLNVFHVLSVNTSRRPTGAMTLHADDC